jgi:hypothetical protein
MWVRKYAAEMLWTDEPDKIERFDWPNKEPSAQKKDRKID